MIFGLKKVVDEQNRVNDGTLTPINSNNWSRQNNRNYTPNDEINPVLKGVTRKTTLEGENKLKTFNLSRSL